MIVASANDTVGANETALAALDAEFRFPDRHGLRDVSLLECARPRRERAVGRDQTDRDLVAEPNQHLGCDAPHELGSVIRYDLRPVEAARHDRRNLNLLQMRQRPIDRRIILPDHGLTLVRIGLADRLLDMPDRCLTWQHAGDGEEAGLQHGVDACTETDLARNLRGIDDKEAQSFAEDLYLHRPRKPVPNLIGAERAVQEEHGARCGELKDILAGQKTEL